MSIAFSMGTPPVSRVERVRVKRETAIMRVSFPDTGSLSLIPSQVGRPEGERVHCTKVKITPTAPIRMAHQ